MAGLASCDRSKAGGNYNAGSVTCNKIVNMTSFFVILSLRRKSNGREQADYCKHSTYVELEDHHIRPACQKLHCAAGLESSLRSSSSRPLRRRGQHSPSQRALTACSSARPAPSTAHVPLFKIVKRQNLRLHNRHVYASREPRAPDQSSIFTLKSCVAQALFITSFNIQTSSAG